MKKPFLFLLLGALPIFVWSQQDSVHTDIKPLEVKQMERFRVAFTCTCTPDSIRKQEFPDNFEVLSGPNWSKSVTYTKGKMSNSTTIAYLLRSSKSGTYSLTGSFFYLDGAILPSGSQTVTVTTEMASQEEQENAKKTTSLFERFFDQHQTDTTLTYHILIQADSGYVSKSRGKYGRRTKVRGLSEKDVSKLLKTLDLPKESKTK